MLLPFFDLYFFFFQAEDGIRDTSVTGVQTCALPISAPNPSGSTMTVRFSTRCPNSDYLGFETSPEAIVAAAKKAEEVGFDAMFVNDHIIVDSSSRAAPWTNVYDPFVAMSFIAAHTTRIGVGVSVLIMPYRNPVATAKSLATIDRMSGGRLIAGVGVGWSEAEFAALGVLCACDSACGLTGRERDLTFRCSGTEGSNPAPSCGE